MALILALIVFGWVGTSVAGGAVATTAATVAAVHPATRERIATGTVATLRNAPRAARLALAGTGAAGVGALQAGLAGVAQRRADPRRRALRATWNATTAGRTLRFLGRRVRTGWWWAGDGASFAVHGLGGAIEGWRNGWAAERRRGQFWSSRAARPSVVPAVAGPKVSLVKAPRPPGVPARKLPPDGPAAGKGAGMTSGSELSTVAALVAELDEYDSQIGSESGLTSMLEAAAGLNERVLAARIAPGSEAYDAISAFSEALAGLASGLSAATERLGVARKAVDAGIGG